MVSFRVDKKTAKMRRNKRMIMRAKFRAKNRASNKILKDTFGAFRKIKA